MFAHHQCSLWIVTLIAPSSNAFDVTFDVYHLLLYKLSMLRVFFSRSASLHRVFMYTLIALCSIVTIWLYRIYRHCLLLLYVTLFIIVYCIVYSVRLSTVCCWGFHCPLLTLFHVPRRFLFGCTAAEFVCVLLVAPSSSAVEKKCSVMAILCHLHLFSHHAVYRSPHHSRLLLAVPV